MTSVANSASVADGSWLDRCMRAVNRLAFLVAFVVTIIGSGVCLWLSILESEPTTEAIIATSGVSAMALILLGNALWREMMAVRDAERREITAARERIRAERKGRYANSCAQRRMLALMIKELSVKLGRELGQDEFTDNTLKAANEQLGHIMNEVASLFSFLTGTACRSTIKVIKSDGTHVWAHTLARDKLSAQRNAGADRERNDR